MSMRLMSGFVICASCVLGCRTTAPPSHPTWPDAEARGAAQEAPPNGSASHGEFAVTPYVWAPGVDGEARARRVRGDLDVDAVDAVEDLELAGVLNVEGRWDRHSAWIEVFGQEIEDEHSRAGGLRADVELEQAFVEGAFAHSLDDARTFDVYAGLRRWNVDTEVDLQPGPSFDQDEEWTDPFVGARKRWTLDEAWGLLLRGDVGGFEIGDASDHTWQVMAQVEREIDEATDWIFGYRRLDVEYDKGRSFEHDVTYDGLFTGVTRRF